MRIPVHANPPFGMWESKKKATPHAPANTPPLSHDQPTTLRVPLPICAEGVVRARGRSTRVRVIPPQRAGRGPRRVPIIIKPGAPVADDEDTEAAGHTQDWAEEGAVDAQRKNRTGRAVAVDNDRRGEGACPPDPFRLAGFR